MIELNMCGIAGIIAKAADVCLKPKLSFMHSALSHRGPDDFGLYENVDTGVGFVHTRLSILDPSPHGHQPMVDSDNNFILVFNGEIYNFRELRAELLDQGYIFRGQSDTEVLLNLYCMYSKAEVFFEEMLRRINGIFAFAIWDIKRETLFLARDALGVKPLYYTETEDFFQFSSEIKALTPLSYSIDHASIDRYVNFLWCPGSGTPTNQIRKLGPGEAIRVKRGVIDERLVWYRLPAFSQKFLDAKVHSELAEVEAIDGTVQHLREAVHRQMVADVPLGAFLSGGLDSSSIVFFSREINPDIRCFTIEVAGMEQEGITNDLPYARRVAEHLQVPLDVVCIDANRMAEDLPAMVSQLDEPLADPASLNVLYISRMAREQGIKVLLSGTGGDDLFTGYRRHLAVNSEGLWSWLPKAALKSLEHLSGELNQQRPLFRRMQKLFSGASLDGDARLVNYFRWVDQPNLSALYSPAFKAALGDARAEDPMLAFLAELPVQTSKLERMIALEQRFFLADHNLIYTDKMSMAAGVEVRVPFLDLELVEFAARIPARFKQRGSEGKWVLKKAMEPYLPRDVIYRSKSGFGAPLRRWMRVELRGLLADVLSSQSLRQRGLFDPEAVQRLIQANDQGKVDASYTLLSLMCIELWCRRFIDQGLATPPLSGSN